MVDVVTRAYFGARLGATGWAKILNGLIAYMRPSSAAIPPSPPLSARPQAPQSASPRGRANINKPDQTSSTSPHINKHAEWSLTQLQQGDTLPRSSMAPRSSLMHEIQQKRAGEQHRLQSQKYPAVADTSVLRGEMALLEPQDEDAEPRTLYYAPLSFRSHPHHGVAP